MITLTTSKAVTTVLGSASTTSYDRMNLVTIHYDVVNKNISGQCQLSSSAAPTATPIVGQYNIPTTGTAVMTVSIPNIPFYASIALTTPQQVAVAGWITTAQNTVEAGFVSVAVVAGVQSTGF